ncbi:MAG: hypothetical protein ACK59A_08300 [Cyanobacteriota bacterium]
MGHWQQNFGRKADNDSRAMAAIKLKAGVGCRNEEARGTEAVGAPLNRENVCEVADTVWVGEDQLAFTLLFHLSMNGRSKGGKKGELTQANTAGMVEEEPIMTGIIPAMHSQGQERANHPSKIVHIL